MPDCYSLRPTENKAVNSDGTKCAVYKPTENKISVPNGGGGGGDGIKTINGKGPDSSGNYQIVADDIPTASETTKGGASFATSEETIAGTVTNKIVTPKTLSDKLGDQTKTYFGIGNGKDQPIIWAPIATTTLDYSFDPVNNKINLNVKNPKQSDWVNEEYDEAAYFASPEDHHAYFANRDEGPLYIQIKDPEEYRNFDTFFVYSMQRGWEITFENPEKGYQMRFLNKFTTAGSGKIQSTNFGKPECRDYIKMTYLSHIKLWIVDLYSSTEFVVS